MSAVAIVRRTPRVLPFAVLLLSMGAWTLPANAQRVQVRPASSASNAALASPDAATVRQPIVVGPRLARPLYRSPDGKVEIVRIALSHSSTPPSGVEPMTLRADARLVIEGRGLADYANGWLLGSGLLRGAPVHAGSALESIRQEDGRLILKVTSISGGTQPWPSQISLAPRLGSADAATRPPALRLRLILGGGAYVAEVPLPRSHYACRPFETNCR